MNPPAALAGSDCPLGRVSVGSIKTAILAILASFLLALSACTGGFAAGGFSPDSTATPTSNGPAGDAEIQLLLGTFVLEGTELAVTVDQARTLLPLWQAVQALSPGAFQSGPPAVAGEATPTPDPTTQAQVERLLGQVRDAMTPDQQAAIATMNVSWDAALAVMQAQGITFRRARQTATALAAGGGANDDSTPPAGPAFPGPLDLLQPRLVNALIDLLEERASGTTEAADGDASATPAATLPANGDPGSFSYVLASGPTATPAGPDLNSVPPANDSPAGALGPIYRLFGGSDRQTGRTLSASAAGESAVYVTNGGSLTLTDSLISASGGASSDGPNAGVLAEGGGTIGMSNSRVTASGNGAYGILASGSGTAVSLSNGTITTASQNEPAAVATEGGSLSLVDVTINTSSSNSDALFAGRDGTLTLRNGTVRTYGTGSIGIHSAGEVTITASTFIVSGGEAAVIDGAASISLNDTSLTSSSVGRWGVLVHQSTPGTDAAGSFSMTGGSLSVTAVDGPLFYVTDTTAAIILNGVSLTSGSGTLLQAAGGTVSLTAEGQVLTGDLFADGSSSMSIALAIDSSLTGAIDADHTAGAIDLTVDPSSTWTVTADSHLACLAGLEGISGTILTNIIGNGHTVYYDRNACPALDARTYDLSGGGTLTPEK